MAWMGGEDGVGGAVAGGAPPPAGDPARIVAWLRALVLDPDDGPWRSALDAAGATPARARAVVDAIPGTAARLGAEWMGDALSMVDVTIGSARLEGALARLGPVVAPRPDGPTLPVLVPPWEQHGLAAALAVHRLHAAGIDAALVLGLRAEAAASLPLVRAAPAILVSCVDRPARARLDDYLRRLVAARTGAAPVLVGGPGFAEARARRPAPPAGVRIANDPVLALRAAGLYAPWRHAHPA